MSVGSGADASIEKSLLFQDFAKSQRLRISGSWYQGFDPPHWTWFSDVGNLAKEIDYIHVSSHWRILEICMIYRKAEFCGTKHRLIVAESVTVNKRQRILYQKSCVGGRRSFLSKLPQSCRPSPEKLQAFITYNYKVDGHIISDCIEVREHYSLPSDWQTCHQCHITHLQS